MPRIRWLILISLLLSLSFYALAQDDTADSAVLPITEDMLYTLQSGDTLDNLGALFDVSPRCIQMMNADLNLGRKTLIGTEILISVACPRYAEDPLYLPTQPVLIPREVVSIEDCEDGVRVAAMDTVASLATLLGVSEEALREANELEADAEPLFNQCLVIPAPTDTSAGAGGGGSINGEFYVIAINDSLDTIAQTYNVSLQSLMIANNITAPKRLVPGTTIFIPADAPAYGTYPPILRAGNAEFGTGGATVEGEEYVMQPRDTLDSIAQEANVALDAILLANNLTLATGQNLPPGTVIIIPDDAPEYGVVMPLVRDTTLGAGGGGPAGEEYVIQPGDTLEGIARLNNVSLQALLMVNNITKTTNLPAGTVIVIPEDAPAFGQFPAMQSALDETAGAGGGGGVDGEIYVMQPGDTLLDIAQANNISLAALKEANGITNGFKITVGTVIIIPAEAKPFSTSLEGNLRPASDAAPTATPTGG